MDYNALAVRFGRIARHLVARDDDDAKCHPRPDIDLCEKPASGGTSTGVTIGVTIAVIVVVTGAVLTFLHLRRKRKDKEEWPKNNQELEDYGIVDPSSTGRQPQRAHYPPQQQQPQQNEDYWNNDTQHSGGFTPQKPARNSLDNLERSLRDGPTTGAFRRQEEKISADMKPVEPSDRL
ncbi:hypothetical protein F4802DRAFT_593513 [Xylaria palmicola]|nr:hypothetical protein F4802DRAFT_593513 [Xylaria palmicola]